MPGTVNILSTEGILPQEYNPQQLNLLQKQEIKQVFSSESYVEFFVLTPDFSQLHQDYRFTDYKILNDGQSSLTNTFSNITVDPLKILENLGFNTGKLITYFNFHNKKIGSNLETLYISNISNDRKEIQLKSSILSNISLIE